MIRIIHVISIYLHIVKEKQFNDAHCIKKILLRQPFCRVICYRNSINEILVLVTLSQPRQRLRPWFYQAREQHILFSFILDNKLFQKESRFKEVNLIHIPNVVNSFFQKIFCVLGIVLVLIAKIYLQTIHTYEMKIFIKNFEKVTDEWNMSYYDPFL